MVQEQLPEKRPESTRRTNPVEITRSGIRARLKQTAKTRQPHLEFTDQPSLAVYERTEPAVVEYASSPESGAQLLRTLNDTQSFTWDIQPLPFSRGDVSVKGTRGFKAIHSAFPGRILCFSGIGIVRANANKYGGIDRKRPMLIIENPREQDPVSDHMPAGTIQMDSKGTVWKERDDSPFGAYDLSNVRRKVRNTIELSGEEDLRVEASGRHGETEMGWMVYSIPDDALTPPELLALDLQLPKAQIGTLYGGMIRALFSKIRGNHRRNIVHTQMHPGNWYAHYDDGNPRPIICDWSTATDLAHLPAPEEFQGDSSFSRDEGETLLQGLDPQQKARAIDLRVALSSATLITAPQFEGMLPVETVRGLQMKFWSVPGWISQDEIDYQLSMIAYALEGYCDAGTTSKEHRRLQATLLNAFKPMAIDAMRKHMGLREETYESIFESERNGVLKPVMNNLLLRVVTLCSMNPERNVCALLLQDPSALPETSVPPEVRNER